MVVVAWHGCGGMVVVAWLWWHGCGDMAWLWWQAGKVDRKVITPSADDPLEAGDELLLVTSAASEAEVQQVFSPHPSS